MRAFPIYAGQIFINNPRIEAQTVNVILKSRHGIPYNSQCVTEKHSTKMHQVI